MTWSIEEVSPTVHKIKTTYKRSDGYVFKILATADHHLDSIYSDHKLIKKHADEASRIGAPIVCFGDLFCAMQGNKDPRKSRIDLPVAIAGKDDYFDAVVDYGYSFMSSYTKSLALIGPGNHDLTVLKHNETNLVKRLIRRLGQDGSNVMMGGYAGWIKILFDREGGGSRCSFNIRYTHGSGGNSPVTKGVIKSNRRAVSYPDAHIVISGHTHDSYIVPIVRERVTDGGKIYKDEQLHVQLPSYKDDATGQPTGFSVEREFMPKPLGAAWLKFWYDPSLRRIRYDAERAL